VLGQNTGLAVFPILSGLATVIVIVGFAVPVVAVSDSNGTDPGSMVPASGWVLIGVGYFVLSFVTIFFNAALVFAADEALRGGRPTVSSGLRAAGGRVGVIVVWSLVSCTISLLLRLIEELGFVGRIIEGILGWAWSLITYLVLPIIVVERAPVRNTVRRSRQLLGRTWGQSLVATVGFGLLTTIAVLLTVVIPGIFAAVVGGVGGAVLLAVAVVCCIGIALLAGAVSGIYRAVLYRYAVEGRIPDAFAGVDLASAFRSKRTKS
jgi:hypothetical protein